MFDVINVLFYFVAFICCSSWSFTGGEVDVKGSPGEQDESLLDNWIKELESGIKGMADLTGAPAEVINTHTLIRHTYGLSDSEC